MLLGTAGLLLALCGTRLLGTTQWDMEKSLCEDMRPPGNEVPQRSPSPYHIYAVWSIRGAVGIFVYGYYSLNNTFRGVLVQVRANATPIGTFNFHNRYAYLLNCPPGKMNLAYNVSRYKQYLFLARWRPPLEYLIMDNVVIHVTVIKERGIFWQMKQRMPHIYVSTTTEFYDADYQYVYDGEDPLMVDSKHIKSDYYY